MQFHTVILLAVVLCLSYDHCTSAMNNVLEFLLPFKTIKNNHEKIPKENENYNDFDFIGL